ncbi:hypothetical protein [Achromobacter spanius]|uniref:Tetratricopeptide repeat protein n=1 Tax=Achromobacter spanius TaxID=217203 RepID=A0A2S0I800_9BURK|nr:hypothetical protein [Achromobacter spanius]AVJ28155.1 hypothetical protein CLM73_14080 [Achromobacter spanius]
MINAGEGMHRVSDLERVKAAADILEAAAKFAKKNLRDSDKAVEPFEQSWHVGVAAYEVREYDAAVGFLSTAYQLRPEARVAAQLAMCYWRLDDFVNAEAWIKLAVATDLTGMHQAPLLKQKVSFLALYSAIQLAQGKIDAAASTVDAALATKVESLSIRVKAHVLLTQGKGDEALEVIDNATKGRGAIAADELSFERRLVEDLLGAKVEVAPFFSISRVGRWPD